MAGGHPVTRRSGEDRLSDPIENIVLWQGSSPVPEGLMSIDWPTRLKMLYFGRGAAQYPKVWWEKCCIMSGASLLPKGLLSIDWVTQLKIVYYGGGGGGGEGSPLPEDLIRNMSLSSRIGNYGTWFNIFYWTNWSDEYEVTSGLQSFTV